MSWLVWFEVNYDIGDPKNRKIFQAIMEILIDPDRPGDFNQALMDLGTDIESAKTPRPDESPIRFFNAAYLNGTYSKYPIKNPKKKPKPMRIQAFVIRNQNGQYLLEKNTKGRLLGGFWSFPIIETSPLSQQLDLFDDNQSNPIIWQTQNETFQREYQLKPQWTDNHFPNIKHTFSHQKWTIELIEGVVKATDLPNAPHLKWAAIEDFSLYPFATPQKKMLETYLKQKNA